jgi:hypothetical protein
MKKGAAIAAPFFFDAYLPLPFFFLAGFASFFAFFAMAGSCGLSSRVCDDADGGSFSGIGVLMMRVKMNRELSATLSTVSINATSTCCRGRFQDREI